MSNLPRSAFYIQDPTYLGIAPLTHQPPRPGHVIQVNNYTQHILQDYNVPRSVRNDYRTDTKRESVIMEISFTSIIMLQLHYFDDSSNVCCEYMHGEHLSDCHTSLGGGCLSRCRDFFMCNVSLPLKKRF